MASDGKTEPPPAISPRTMTLPVNKPDPINPTHYGGTMVDELIEKFKLSFRLGNAVKYIARHKNKNGLEDLKKALWYLQREIDRYDGT